MRGAVRATSPSSAIYVDGGGGCREGFITGVCELLLLAPIAHFQLES